MTNEINQEKGPAHTDNPYAPPKTEIQIPTPLSEADFYVVSLNKLVILNIVTLGLYSIYWFFKNWDLYKQSVDNNIWPIPRAIFNIFFVHSLFGKIKNAAENATNNSTPDLTFYATLFVIIQIVNAVIPDDINPIVILIFALTYLGLCTWCLYNAQKQANIACNDSDGESNNTFNATNYVFIVLGSLLWSLFIFGTIILAV